MKPSMRVSHVSRVRHEQFAERKKRHEMEAVVVDRVMTPVRLQKSRDPYMLQATNVAVSFVRTDCVLNTLRECMRRVLCQNSYLISAKYFPNPIKNKEI